MPHRLRDCRESYNSQICPLAHEPFANNIEKAGKISITLQIDGADDGIRTHDINLGKVALYP